MKLLNEAQAEQLREISKYLVQVRQEKSIRLEEVAAKTHIRLILLKALDAGQFEELPEPIYIQGFIRRYADTLGLDGAALANSFTINVLPPETQQDNQQEHQQEHQIGNKISKIPIFAGLANSLTVNVLPPEAQQDNQQEHQIGNKIPKIRIPIVVSYVLLVGVAALGLIYILNPKLTAKSSANKQNSLPSNSIQTTPSPVASSPIAKTLPSGQDAVAQATPKTTPSPLSTASAPSPKNTDNSKVKVSLELQGNSWIEVKADGKTEFVGNLTKGQRKTWTAEKQLSVRSGNAGAVLIAVNEQPAKPLGGEGEVKQVTYSAKGNGQ